MSLQRQTGLTTLKDLRNIVQTRMEAKEKARGDLVLETHREGLTVVLYDIVYTWLCNILRKHHIAHHVTQYRTYYTQ